MLLTWHPPYLVTSAVSSLPILGKRMQKLPLVKQTVIVCVCYSYRSEANELALQIADVVTGHTERVSVDG